MGLTLPFKSELVHTIKHKTNRVRGSVLTSKSVFDSCFTKRQGGPLPAKTMSVSPWPSSTTTCSSLDFLGVWRNCLCFFFFFFGGGVGHDRQGEGRARGWRERGRQAERVYWLVSLYSVDCDKFNCGSPLKADASPEPPPPPPLPLRLFPLSFSHALWGRSVWLDIRCLLRANGYSRCLFLLHG